MTKNILSRHCHGEGEGEALPQNAKHVNILFVTVLSCVTVQQTCEKRLHTPQDLCIRGSHSLTTWRGKARGLGCAMPWLFTRKRGTCRMEAIMAYGKEQGRKIVQGKIVTLFTYNVIRVEDAEGTPEGVQAYTDARNALGLLPLLDEEGYRVESIPCWECDGQGKHSRHLGEITPSEWEDDDLQHYFAGGYDRPCRRCWGQGTLDVHVQCLKHIEDCDSRCRCEQCRGDEESYEREQRAIYRAESGLGWDW
jgi:hypothetical protein